MRRRALVAIAPATLAALFLLHRDVFVIRGGHFEPCIPAGAVRKLLAAAMGRRGTR